MLKRPKALYLSHIPGLSLTVRLISIRIGRRQNAFLCKMGKCQNRKGQNWKVLELEGDRTGKYQNWKVPKSGSVRIGIRIATRYDLN